MKSTLVITLLSALVAVFAAAEPQKIAFQRGDNIWIANIDGTAAKKIAVGSGPFISSAGTQVAFATATSSDYRSQARGAQNDPISRIALVDIPPGKLTTLKNIPADRCSSPIWSPDSRWIIF